MYVIENTCVDGIIIWQDTAGRGFPRSPGKGWIGGQLRYRSLVWTGGFRDCSQLGRCAVHLQERTGNPSIRAKNSSLPLRRRGVFSCLIAIYFRQRLKEVATDGFGVIVICFADEPLTPQEQFLHRNGILFNYSTVLYQTRYDYFNINHLNLSKICSGIRYKQNWWFWNY